MRKAGVQLCSLPSEVHPCRPTSQNWTTSAHGYLAWSVTPSTNGCDCHHSHEGQLRVRSVLDDAAFQNRDLVNGCPFDGDASGGWRRGRSVCVQWRHTPPTHGDGYAYVIGQHTGTTSGHVLVSDVYPGAPRFGAPASQQQCGGEWLRRPLLYESILHRFR